MAPEGVEEVEPCKDTAEDTKSNHETLKYQLLGPSLNKAGQKSVDQSKVSEIIYNASKGSKFFNHEEARDKVLTEKISRILAEKQRLETLDLTRELRHADTLVAQLELSRDLSQIIVHIDCDAFYAAVEQLDQPELAELPFAVGGGVLTTCNYVARRHGCRSGMAAFVARRLCPDLIVLPLNFDKYRAKAAEVRAVLSRYDPRFESASIDEAYLNLTAYCAEHGLPPAEAVQRLRSEVHAAAKITVSAGIAANARLAKICSDINKPNGQFELPNDRTTIMDFMRNLPCRKVNGVGRVLERELSALGIVTCGDVYEQRQFLARLFGDKTFEFLLRCHLGLGRTRVQPSEEHERKSVGSESTFRDLSDPVLLREKLRSTAVELEADMRKAACKGRTLVLKIKLHTYEVYTRQAVPPKAVYQADDLYNYALPMLAKLEQEIPGMKLRLMGLRCTNLVSTKKPDTLAFFGLKPRRTSSTDSGDQSGSGKGNGKGPGTVEEHAEHDGRWEEPWSRIEPWEETMNNIQGDRGAMIPDSPMHEGDTLPTTTTTTTQAAAETAPEGGEEEEEWWDCPVCSRPQAADERRFNEHIDLCLSRQTIRDAVQQLAGPALSGVDTATAMATSESRRVRAVTEKKRGRPPGRADPRQKKLCFGS